MLIELSVAYSEPHRRYHTLGHIADILSFAVSCNLSLTVEQYYAVWFHDAVYDPTRSDNEERSAFLAEEMIPPLGGIVDVSKIKQIILDTKTHTPSSEESALVLDLDMSILASTPATYDKYVAAVRCEYSHLSDEAWRTGRLAWIEQVLKKPLFSSERFKDLDAMARSNLIREQRKLTHEV